MVSAEFDSGPIPRRQRGYEKSHGEDDKIRSTSRRHDAGAEKPKRREQSGRQAVEKEHRRSRSPDSEKLRPHSRERERVDRIRQTESKGERNRRQRQITRLEEDDYRDRRRRRSHGENSLRSEEKLSDADLRGKGNRQSLDPRRGPLPSQNDSFAVSTGTEPEKSIEKPNFGTSGLLAAASNSVTQADGSTVTLRYHEPPEARKPAARDQWKLFVFKGPDIIDTVELSLRSCWLIGRDAAVVDLQAEHPSISKQHAVIQFRFIEKYDKFGDKAGKVKPYLIDLESPNGTVLNGKKVPESRYLELRDKDMLQFGQSTREYILMLSSGY